VGKQCECISGVWGAKIIDLGVWCKYYRNWELLFNIPKFTSRP